MGEAALKLPTFEELYTRIEHLPQGVTGEILEPGVLRTMARPGRRHGGAFTLASWWAPRGGEHGTGGEGAEPAGAP